QDAASARTAIHLIGLENRACAHCPSARADSLVENWGCPMLRASILFFFLVGCRGKTDAIPDAGLDGGNPLDTGVDTGSGDGANGNDSGDAGKFHCSADLRSILDDSDIVIKTCHPDRGCAGGQCIDACAAAAAGRGSIGCDYLVPTPSFYPTIKPPCFALFVANNWPSDVKLTISLGGTNYDVTQFGRIATSGMPETSWPAIPMTGIPAGKAAVLFLSHDPASQNATPLTCPVTPAI